MTSFHRNVQLKNTFLNEFEGTETCEVPVALSWRIPVLMFHYGTLPYPGVGCRYTEQYFKYDAGKATW